LIDFLEQLLFIFPKDPWLKFFMAQAKFELAKEQENSELLKMSLSIAEQALTYLTTEDGSNWCVRIDMSNENDAKRISDLSSRINNLLIEIQQRL